VNCGPSVSARTPHRQGPTPPKTLPLQMKFRPTRALIGPDMARTDKTGRSRVSGPFLMLPSYMLKSPAWKSLKAIERAALIEVLGRYNGSNNGRLGMSARVLARELHVSRATATRALCTLCKCGFLEVVKPSAFSCKAKRAAEFRATLHRCDVTGQPPARAFMRWKPEIHFTASPRSNVGFTTEQ
jgi:hypothetical protein